MQFRVVNWNMQKASKKEPLPEKLRWIWNAHAPDVLLAQECPSPFDRVPGEWSGTKPLWWPKLPHKTMRDGCAIIAPKMVIEKIDPGPLQGWVTIGVATLPIGQTAIISLHAPTVTKDHEAFGLRRKTCGTWMMEVAMPYIEDCVARYANVVIGGDINCSRHIAQCLNNRVYREAHECMSAVYGYTEALYICNNDREMPTWRRSKCTEWTVPNDHLFVRGPLADPDHLKTSKVMLNPDPQVIMRLCSPSSSSDPESSPEEKDRSTKNLL